MSIAGGNEKAGKQEVGTPKLLIEKLRETFQIDVMEMILDLAGDSSLHVEECYLKQIFDEAPIVYEEDSLDSDGRVVGAGALRSFHHFWLNPPFSHISKFLKRALELRRGEDDPNLYALVLASVGSKWWREIVVESSDRPDVFFLSPRITFDGFKHEEPRQTALLVWSPRSCGQAAYWNWKTGKVTR